VQAAINSPEGPESIEFKKVIEARSFAGKFNLMAAMKAAEAKRTADETWERLAPPLQKLNKEDKQKLYNGLSKIFA
jgi:4-hydroxy-tetrahydrodipicolinate synthase